jgi:hypothetical protein
MLDAPQLFAAPRVEIHARARPPARAVARDPAATAAAPHSLAIPEDRRGRQEPRRPPRRRLAGRRWRRGAKGDEKEVPSAGSGGGI